MTPVDVACEVDAAAIGPSTRAPGLFAAPSPAERDACGQLLLEMSGITKRWRGIDQPVLEDVHLKLPSGSATWLSGRNGAGKTTLMRIAAGLIGADTGSVTLGGLDPITDRRAYQSRTCFLSAGVGGLYARLSVEWHLDWWGRLALLSRARRRELAERALRRFELADLRRRRVDRLSMGQRQRVRLAGTFLREADLVLLDEPRSSLDAEGVEVVETAVADAIARGSAVVWAAPTGEEPPRGFQRQLHLESGRLLPK
jgi:ABC-type multidrug transport system ATPase subunit